MKKYFILFILFLICQRCLCQSFGKYINELWGIKHNNTKNIFLIDKLPNIIDSLLNNNKIKLSGNDFKYVNFCNENASEYVKVYRSPGNGFGVFYEVGIELGYKKHTIKKMCLPYVSFSTNSNITIGNSRQSIFSKLSMDDFRFFSHKNIQYFIFEDGLYNGNDRRSPATVEFLKFKNGVLISFGFGFGYPGFNPVFPPE